MWKKKMKCSIAALLCISTIRGMELPATKVYDLYQQFEYTCKSLTFIARNIGVIRQNILHHPPMPKSFISQLRELEKQLPVHATTINNFFTQNYEPEDTKELLGNYNDISRLLKDTIQACMCMKTVEDIKKKLNDILKSGRVAKSRLNYYKRRIAKFKKQYSPKFKEQSILYPSEEALETLSALYQEVKQNVEIIEIIGKSSSTKKTRRSSDKTETAPHIDFKQKKSTLSAQPAIQMEDVAPNICPLSDETIALILNNIHADNSYNN